MPIATLAPQLWFYETYDDGRPLVNGLVESLLAGTTTPTPTFTDKDLAVPNSNPIVLDASGRAIVRLDPSKAYKFVVKTPQGVVLRTVDHVGPVAPYTSDLDVQGVAGENLAANDAVYMSGGDGGTISGRWYRTDADVVAKSSGANLVAMAPYGMLNGQTGAIRIQGRLTGFSGLVPGAPYFVSTIAGAITAVAPLNRKYIGVAESATTLVFTPTQSFLQGDIHCATITTSGAANIGGGLTVAGSLIVGGATSVAALDVGGLFTVSGPATFQASLVVAGALVAQAARGHAMGGGNGSPNFGLVMSNLAPIASGGFAAGLFLGGTWTATANNDLLVGLRTGSGGGAGLQANVGSFTGVKVHSHQLVGSSWNKVGSATVDLATTLHIQDAPTIGTENYALLVSGGRSMFVEGVYERNRTAAMGEWVNVPYSAGDYTASTGTWTVEPGDLEHFQYTVVGKTMMLVLSLISTTLAGVTNELRVKIPGGYLAASRDWLGPVHIAGGDNGPALALLVTRGGADADKLAIFKGAFQNWANSTDNTSIKASISFKIQ